MITVQVKSGARERAWMHAWVWVCLYTIYGIFIVCVILFKNDAGLVGWLMPHLGSSMNSKFRNAADELDDDELNIYRLMRWGGEVKVFSCVAELFPSFIHTICIGGLGSFISKFIQSWLRAMIITAVYIIIITIIPTNGNGNVNHLDPTHHQIQKWLLAFLLWNYPRMMMGNMHAWLMYKISYMDQLDRSGGRPQLEVFLQVQHNRCIFDYNLLQHDSKWNRNHDLTISQL